MLRKVATRYSVKGMRRSISSARSAFVRPQLYIASAYGRGLLCLVNQERAKRGLPLSVAPRLAVEVYEAFRAGEHERARAAQSRLARVTRWLDAMPQYELGHAALALADLEDAAPEGPGL